MKATKKALFYAIFSFFSYTLFAQTSLCNSVNSFLKKNGCRTTTQSLVSTGTNSFPYNISAEFPGKHISQDNNFFNISNLYLIFNQEDAEENKEVLQSVIEYLKKSDFPFNINLVFVYGEKQLLEKEGIVYGTNTFLSFLNTTEDSTVILINLNQKESSIVATSSGKTAPSWLIKNEHDLFKKEKIPHGLPIFYISQLYSYSFKKDRQLDSFFSYDIPTIILNFSDEIEKSATISNILINSIELFSTTQNKTWEQHFLMLSILGHYYTLTETTAVKIVVLSIFIILLFLSIISFLNKNLQQDAWNKFKNIWYIVPITFLIVFGACFTTKAVSLLLAKISHLETFIFLFIGGIVLFSFLFISVYYCILIILNKNLQLRLLDFIIIITMFINQFIFSIYDISLFPIFLFIFLLSILAYFVKNNAFHIAIFVLMFFPLGFYTHSLIQTYDSSLLYNFFISNNYTYIFISLLLYPCFLMYLRILGDIKNYFQNKKTVFISTASTMIIVIIITVTFYTIRTIQIKKQSVTLSKNIEFIPEDENSVQITYKDKIVFDDLVRTIDIYFSKPCYECDVRIVADETPILYSSDSFEPVNLNTAYFKIPNNPPLHMTFSYGTTTATSKINVTAIYQTDDAEQFSLATKSITIR